jgi:4-methyl-5(b-hydroxyethyl)-thiazole monophosphate biosynthesis
MPHVITILAPGFEETEAIVPIDLLRRAQVTVTILGLESCEVRGSHDIAIVADKLLSEFSGSFDGIVLPGGQPGTKNLSNSPQLLDIIRETYKRGALCAAICAAPTVLAKAGILDGVKATCFPGCEKELASAIVLEQTVVRDRNVITSRGVGTAIPFGLELISYLQNPDAAEKVKTAIVY